MLFVVPVNVDTGILGYFPVSGDGVVLFGSGEKVFGVEFLHRPSHTILCLGLQVILVYELLGNVG